LETLQWESSEMKNRLSIYLGLGNIADNLGHQYLVEGLMGCHGGCHVSLCIWCHVFRREGVTRHSDLTPIGELSWEL
jgi:hypothetical protein